MVHFTKDTIASSGFAAGSASFMLLLIDVDAKDEDADAAIPVDVSMTEDDEVIIFFG